MCIVYNILGSSLACNSLTSPINGKVSVSSTTVDSVANYICDEGFLLEGSSYRKCTKENVWSGTAPVCKPRCNVTDLYLC